MAIQFLQIAQPSNILSLFLSLSETKVCPYKLLNNLPKSLQEFYILSFFGKARNLSWKKFLGKQVGKSEKCFFRKNCFVFAIKKLQTSSFNIKPAIEVFLIDLLGAWHPKAAKQLFPYLTKQRYFPGIICYLFIFFFFGNLSTTLLRLQAVVTLTRLIGGRGRRINDK